MRRLAPLLLVLAWPAIALAENARELTLPELMRGMATTSGVELRFEETKEIGLLAAPLVSRGVLYFVPPDKLARYTLEPSFSGLVVDADSVRFRDSLEAEPMDLSSSRTARIFVDNFIVLWSGDLERLQQLYRTDFRSEDGSWSLKLTPRAAQLARFVDHVKLEGDGAGIREIVLLDSEGDRTRTRFEGPRSQRRFAPAEARRVFVEGLPLAGGAGEP